MESVEVRGTIRLGQFLQVAGLVDSGSHAHALIAGKGCRQALVEGTDPALEQRFGLRARSRTRRAAAPGCGPRLQPRL